MGGRGSSSFSGGGGGTGGLSSSDILSTRDLVGEIGGDNRALVGETLDVFKDVSDEYGAQVNEIQLAQLAVGSSALAYYDANGNIAVNEAYFNKNMEAAYKDSVTSGFHPSNGNKTAIQAVVAHELGHKLTQDVGVKLGKGGWSDFDSVAERIVTEARRSTTHKNNSSLAKKISGYARHSNAETIAEAFSDVYCNGNKSRSESRAIVGVLSKYLKS